MCGIFGVVNSRFLSESDKNPKFLDRLRHRGPDGEGVWYSSCNRVFLGHRRLSILDLSDKSAQPMIDEVGLAITFNGEIYNYQDIKSQLSGFGEKFYTTGDAEVLLKAYKQWGISCLDKLNGMFAFVIYDPGIHVASPAIFFARDRVGKKPFYYSHSLSKKKFIFASELKAIEHAKEIDLKALNFYLAFGFIPYDLCLFNDVNKLPPAHYGILEIETNRLVIRRYWSLPLNSPDPFVSEIELAEHVDKLLEDSIKLRLVADVPVGILLSGGLDSSLITATAARVSSVPIETFTITLPNSPLSEAKHAQRIAGFFNTNHHILPLESSSIKLLDGLTRFIDEPIADSSIIPSWLVFGLARSQVKVALGGDGGDELFGGYSTYLTCINDLLRFGWLPKSILYLLAKIAALLPPGVLGRNKLLSLRHGLDKQFIWGTPYFDSFLRKNLLTEDTLQILANDLTAPEEFLLSLFMQGNDQIDRMTRMDLNSILPDDFLVKVDRASMMCGLEVRNPFLDYRLIEFAFGKISSDCKVSANKTRRVERILAKKRLPPDFEFNRKQGFSIPINEWLRGESESNLMQRMEGLPNSICMDYVLSLVRGHLCGRSNGGRLFALIMLASCMRNLQN